MSGKLTKAEGGRLGALRRWGPVPRSVRLDTLDPRIAAAVVALVRADENSRTTKAPAPLKADAQEVDRATDHTTAQR